MRRVARGGAAVGAEVLGPDVGFVVAVEIADREVDADLAIRPSMLARCSGEWSQATKIERTVPWLSVPQAMFSPARQQRAAR